MQYHWITVTGIVFIFLMNTLGALSVYAFKADVSQKMQTLFFGFSAGVMLAAAVWSLLLPSIEQSQYLGAFSFAPAAFGFLIGGLFLFGLDRLVGILQRSKGKGSGMRASIKLFLAVTLHNIPEGLAVGVAFGSARLLGTEAGYFAALGLSVGIGIQNLPEGAAVALPMLQDGKSPRSSFLYGFVSGAVEPIFAAIGYFIATGSALFQPWLLAISAGAMVYVTAEELLPDIGRGKYVTAGAWSFMLGFLLMMTLDVALG